MFLDILFIIIGFAFLIKGADFLVDGASGIAKKFRIPEIIIGLTIVAIGTSMPELFVSANSAIRGYSEMSLGNVIGSNLCNLLLILGLTATINPIIFKKETKLIEIPLCLGVTVVFIAFCNLNKDISRIESIILLGLYASFIGYTIFMALRAHKRKPKKENKDTGNGENAKQRSSILNTIFIILGIVLLKFGGDLTVESAEHLARLFNISDKVISLTVVAIGTSLPELVTSVTAAVKKDSDIAIGNILGSNIANMLLIIGVAGAIAPMSYNTSYNIQLVILIVATAVLALFPYTDKKDEMTMSNGITYLMLYALYMGLLFVL